MQVQWFPGHMHKTRKQLSEQIKRVDLVLEILDARVPRSSRNPLLNSLIKGKQRLLILNKADLADRALTQQWINRLKQEQGAQALAYSAKQDKSTKPIIQACFQIAREKLNKASALALVVGIPNVGKSTILNRMRGKKSAAVGNRPAVTRSFQRVRISDNLALVDTPGILWPRFDNQEVGINLAIIGSIRDEILPLEEMAMRAMEIFQERYPGRLQERFKLRELVSDAAANLEALGTQRGCLLPGGKIDFYKSCTLFLKELRAGKLGRFTLENAEDIPPGD